MTLSHGSSAMTRGSLRKGLPVMLLAGVLAWVSGQSWSSGRSSPEVFALFMVFGTLATMSVAAQLIAGPRARPWLMATTAAVGLGVPWFFGLALARGGQGVWIETALIVSASWVVVYATTWGTRHVLRRTLRS